MRVKNSKNLVRSVVECPYFKSPLTVVRANYGLSGAVFGFVIGVIVFEILSIFWQNNAFLEKMGHFSTKSTISPKL